MWRILKQNGNTASSDIKENFQRWFNLSKYHKCQEDTPE